jgi:hypothetical protein
MRQETMKTHPDAEAPSDPPERKRQGQRLPVEHKERGQRAQVKDHHENGGVPVNAGLLLLDHFFVTHKNTLSLQSLSIPSFDVGL